MIESGKKIYLCDPANNIIVELNGLVTDTVDYSNHTKDYRILTCEVDRYIIVDGEQIVSSGYDQLAVNMQLLLEDIGYFQLQQPEENNDGTREYKALTAYSCEKEFESKDVLSFKVNTGEDGSLERLNTDNLDTSTEVTLPVRLITLFYTISWNRCLDGLFETKTSTNLYGTKKQLLMRKIPIFMLF